MIRSDKIGELAKALVAFQGEVSNPRNTARNPFFDSSYSPLPEILNTIREPLNKHGLAVIQDARADGETVTVSTVILHTSGEYLETCPLVLPLGDKPTAQGAGSALTYARRYSLSAALGVSSEDDDDGNSAEPKPAKKPAKKAKEAATTITQTAAFKKMMALVNEVFTDYTVEERGRLMHEHIEAAYGITSSKELDAGQISQVIEWLEGWRESGEELP